MGYRTWQTMHAEKRCDRCERHDTHHQGDPLPDDWEAWLKFNMLIDPGPANPLGTSAEYLLCPACRGTIEYVLFEGRPPPDANVPIPVSRVQTTRLPQKPLPQKPLVRYPVKVTDDDDEDGA